MNQRHDIREPLERKVLIYRCAARPVRGQTRDVSFDGIFIAFPKCFLQRGTLVDMAVTKRTCGVTWMHHISAEVSRLTEDGIGFMFVLNDVRKITRFVALLRDIESVLRVGRCHSYGTFPGYATTHGVLLFPIRGKRVISARAADSDQVTKHNAVTGENHDDGKLG